MDTAWSPEPLEQGTKAPISNTENVHPKQSKSKSSEATAPRIHDRVRLRTQGQTCRKSSSAAKGRTGTTATPWAGQLSQVSAQRYEETARGRGSFTQRGCVGVGGKQRELTGHGD